MTIDSKDSAEEDLSVESMEEVVDQPSASQQAIPGMVFRVLEERARWRVGWRILMKSAAWDAVKRMEA